MLELFTFDFGLIFWQSVLLVMVMGLLARFAWGPILSFIQAEEARQAQAALALEKARQVSATLKQQQQALADQAAEEHVRLADQAAQARKALLAEAKSEALAAKEALLAKAKQELAAERAQATAALRSHVAMLTLQATEKLLQRELGEAAQQEAFITKLLEGAPEAAVQTLQE